jgi:EamA domain-containing membrane protein RarD
MKSFVKHLPHYFVLFGVLFAGVLAFTLFSYDKIFQMIVTIAVAVSYVVWGLIHHWIHRDLYFSVVIEYLVVATLGVVVVFSLILRT